MSQAHAIICPGAKSYLDSFMVESSSRARDQVFSGEIGLALAGLCAPPRGSHPRDLPWLPDGVWAGQRILDVADGSQNGDLQNLTDPISEHDLYRACKRRSRRFDMPARDGEGLQDVLAAFIPVIERVRSVRAHDWSPSGTRHAFSHTFLDVVQTPQGWGLAYDDALLQDGAVLKAELDARGILKAEHWRRDPITVDPERHFAPAAPVPMTIDPEGTGDHLLWVSLDRQEYIDPAALGDTPGLFGIMTGCAMPAVLASLHLRIPRAEGDLEPDGPVAMVGRWRGDRIALIGPRGLTLACGSHIAQDDILQCWCNISDNARAFLEIPDLEDRSHLAAIARPGPLDELSHDIAIHVLGSLSLEPGQIEQSSVEISAPIEIEIAQDRRFNLAPNIRVFCGRSELHLAPAAFEAIRPLVAQLPVQKMKAGGGLRPFPAFLSRYRPRSNHEKRRIGRARVA